MTDSDFNSYWAGLIRYVYTIERGDKCQWCPNRRKNVIKGAMSFPRAVIEMIDFFHMEEDDDTRVLIVSAVWNALKNNAFEHDHDREKAQIFIEMLSLNTQELAD